MALICCPVAKRELGRTKNKTTFCLNEINNLLFHVSIPFPFLLTICCGVNNNQAYNEMWLGRDTKRLGIMASMEWIYPWLLPERGQLPIMINKVIKVGHRLPFSEFYKRIAQ